MARTKESKIPIYGIQSKITRNAKKHNEEEKIDQSKPIQN